MRRGLLPTNRPHVHLTWRREHARSAVKDERSPVLLKIDAAAMHARGMKFYVSPKGSWLVARVPPDVLQKENDEA